jgi:hypothetical protein
VDEGYESISPYASMYNDPVRISDPLGDEGGDCCLVAGELVQEAKNASRAGPVGEAIAVGTLFVAGIVAIGEFIADHPAVLSGGNANSKYYGTLQTAQAESAAGQKVFTEKPQASTPKGTVSLNAKESAELNRPLTKPTDIVKKQAPGQTAAGHPTDVHGNKLGPSGKPQVDVVNHPTQKRAKDAARAEGQGAPVKHTNPKKGGDHYHPTDKDGNKKPNSTHHEYS